MRDFYDTRTPDLLTGETQMLFQVNYKYIHENGKIRSAPIAIEAKDTKEARTRAIEEIRKEVTHFEITSIKTWGTSKP